MSILNTYQDAFLEQYSNYPQNRYISILIVREIQSEAIFRTEGSGEPLNREFVHAGATSDSPIIQRAVISKRKQTAVERRTGRELLREFNLLGEVKGDVCALNRNTPCEKCLDCMIYGFAAGGGGAQRSRVITDDAFSLHSARTIIGERQFNALYDNSTMRDPETGKASTSIGTDEYIKPETLFLDIETFHDLTLSEFIYAFGNILRSVRYGAISTRIGKVQNHIAGIVLSDSEIYSNLELTQHAYDRLKENGEEPTFPLPTNQLLTTARNLNEEMLKQFPARTVNLSESEIQQLIAEVTAIYQDENQLREILQTASQMYGK